MSKRARMSAILAIMSFVIISSMPGGLSVGARVVGQDGRRQERQSPASSSDNQAPSPANGTWEVEINSSGGIHGLGNGSVRITASGSATVSSLNKSCSARVPAEMMPWFERIVLATRPTLRKDPAPLLPTPVVPCCDRIGLTLILSWKEGDGTERSHKIFWHEYEPTPLPGDLEALRSAAMMLRALLLQECKD
jgi:hypothetical protein